MYQVSAVAQPCAAAAAASSSPSSSSLSSSSWLLAARRYVEALTSGGDLITPLRSLSRAVGGAGGSPRPVHPEVRRIVHSAMLLGAESEEVVTTASSLATRLAISALHLCDEAAPSPVKGRDAGSDAHVGAATSAGTSPDRIQFMQEWQRLVATLIRPEEQLMRPRGLRSLSFVDTAGVASAALMRDQVRRGNWDRACSMFASSFSQTTAETAAVVGALVAGGQLGRATDVLERLPVAARGELEVAALLKSVLRSSKRRGGQSTDANLADAQDVVEEAATAAAEAKERRGDCDPLLWCRAIRLFSETVALSGGGGECEVHGGGGGSGPPLPLLLRHAGRGAPSIALVNHAIGVLAAHNRWEESAALASRLLVAPSSGAALKDLEQQQPHPHSANVVTVTMLCHALQSQWHLALHYTSLLISQNRLTQKLDRIALTQIAFTCALSARWAEAAAVCSIADAQQLVLDPAIYCRVIDVCNKGSQSDIAAKLLRYVHKCNNADATARALNSMLQHAKTLSAAQSWLSAIRHRGLRLEFESYEVLIHRLCCCDRWDDALGFLQGMLLQQHQEESRAPAGPSARAYELVLVSMSRQNVPWEASLQLFSQMEQHRVEPRTTVAFKAVVASCLDQGAKEAAHGLFLHQMRRGTGTI